MTMVSFEYILIEGYPFQLQSEGTSGFPLNWKVYGKYFVCMRRTQGFCRYFERGE